MLGECKAIKSVCHPLWIWGHLLKLYFCSIPRGGLGQDKLIAAGTSVHIMVEIRSLLRAVDYNRTGFPAIGDLPKYFEELTVADLTAVIKNGAKMVQLTPPETSIVYAPPGWVTLEWSLTGPLLYGVRKSVFIKAPSAVQALMEYNKASGKDKEYEKLKAIAETMQK